MIMTLIASTKKHERYIIIGTCTLLIYKQNYPQITQIKQIVNKRYKIHLFLTFQANNYIILAIEQKSISNKQNMYIHS